jgi:DNA-damage-inducible protein J
MTDCVVRSRVDSHIKIEAVRLFEHMGLTLSEAVRLFLYQSIAEKRIPFEISMPNAITREALESTKCGKNLEKTSLRQLAKDWDEACVK